MLGAVSANVYEKKIILRNCLYDSLTLVSLKKKINNNKKKFQHVLSILLRGTPDILKQQANGKNRQTKSV